GSVGLALRAPGLRESRRGLIDQVAHFDDGAEPGLVRHRTHYQRPDDVARYGDRDDRRAATLNEALERRGAVGVPKRVHELVERRRGHDAPFAARAGDRVVAVGELDREAAGRDPEGVVELASGR